MLSPRRPLPFPLAFVLAAQLTLLGGCDIVPVEDGVPLADAGPLDAAPSDADLDDSGNDDAGNDDLTYSDAGTADATVVATPIP